MQTTTTSNSAGLTTTWYSPLFNDPFFIGFDKFANRISHSSSHNATGFPPYNVRKIDEDTFAVELAVAGFSKDDLKITEHDGTLKIEGDRMHSDDEYLYKGIATRKFTRTFALGEYMYVDGADLTDGVLYIIVKRDIPDEKKPKNIDIR